MESRSKIIVWKANIIFPTDSFYCVEIVNFTVLTFISEFFGNISNTRLRVIEYVWALTVDCGREVKSQYWQEVAHGRNLRTQKKLRLESLSIRRETLVYRVTEEPDLFSVAGNTIRVLTGTPLALDLFLFSLFFTFSFSFFFHYRIPNPNKQTKIVKEKTSTFWFLWHWHDNFKFPSPDSYCISMVIFTVRTMFFILLRKCYKITASHSDFELECQYNFWLLNFSRFELSLSFFLLNYWIPNLNK